MQIIVLVGPTAVGKTEYAIEIAKNYGGEIISADSMQIYKYMDIGSAKPTKEELAMVPHHLIGEIDPREKFSVAAYQKMAKAEIKNVAEKGRMPVIAGGTGLYVNSLLYEMDFTSESESSIRADLETKSDEELYALLCEKSDKLSERIHPNNRKKIIRALEVLLTTGEEIPDFDNSFVKTSDYDVILLGLTRDRDELYERINKRVEIMMREGLVDEIKCLMAMGLDEADISMKGIGYKEVIAALNGEYPMEDAVELIQKNSRHYAKRQITWFKRLDDLKWFNLSDFESKEAALNSIYKYIDERRNH